MLRIINEVVMTNYKQIILRTLRIKPFLIASFENNEEGSYAESNGIDDTGGYYGKLPLELGR